MHVLYGSLTIDRIPNIPKHLVINQPIDIEP